MAPNTGTWDALSLDDPAQQLYECFQLWLGKWIPAITIIHQFDANRLLAEMEDMMRYPILGHAAAHGAIAVNHVVHAQLRMGLDIAQILSQRAGTDPDQLTGLRVAGWAARGMDDDHLDSSRATRATAQRKGIRCDQQQANAQQ